MAYLPTLTNFLKDQRVEFELQILGFLSYMAENVYMGHPKSKLFSFCSILYFVILSAFIHL